MLVIDVTPGLAPALLLNSRFPLIIRAVGLLVATSCTVGAAIFAARATRRRGQS